MADYFTAITTQLGIPMWLFVVLLVWSAAWKFTAMWKSARNTHLIWFIVIALTNTVGILPILYIFVFSKMGKSKKKSIKKRAKKKKR